MSAYTDLCQQLKTAVTLEAILDIAIAFERESFDYYCHWAVQAEGELRDLLASLADEELRHCDLLMGLREQIARVQDLGQGGLQAMDPADWGCLERPPELRSGELSREAVIHVAAARERLAVERYEALAQGLEEGHAKELFQYLAIEEAAHRDELARFFGANG